MLGRIFVLLLIFLPHNGSLIDRIGAPIFRASTIESSLLLRFITILERVDSLKDVSIITWLFHMSYLTDHTIRCVPTNLDVNSSIIYSRPNPRDHAYACWPHDLLLVGAADHLLLLYLLLIAIVYLIVGRIVFPCHLHVDLPGHLKVALYWR